jgi:phospholipid-binding lipoprotein MlaA
MSPRLLPLLLAVLATGCASLPSGKADPRDRFERFNRSVFSFNQGLDKHIAQPVARGYVKVAPAPVRSGVSNFFANLGYPTVIVNDLLQAKPLPFLKDTTRFAVNTTVGIGGLFDPASKFGLESNNEDFGQTLGRWGIGTGPYLVLPLLGPSDARDLVGRVADHFTQPTTYVDDRSLAWGLRGGELLDTRAATLEASDVMNRAFDPYAFMRNAYLQRRRFLVLDGNLPDDPPQAESDDSAGEE